jgi:hypothetical protein
MSVVVARRQTAREKARALRMGGIAYVSGGRKAPYGTQESVLERLRALQMVGAANAGGGRSAVDKSDGRESDVLMMI